jgi:uncharacterized membrane protein YtjA (UPF0391 family)
MGHGVLLLPDALKVCRVRWRWLAWREPILSCAVCAGPTGLSVRQHTLRAGQRRSLAHRPQAALPRASAWPTQEPALLHYATLFFVIALIAAVLGFGGLASGAAGIARLLFGVFFLLALVSGGIALLRRR